MTHKTLTVSVTGQKKIQEAILAKKWNRSRNYTSGKPPIPLVTACLEYIKQYQEDHNLHDNAHEWLKNFEEIFRLGEESNESKEIKNTKLAEIKNRIIKISGCTVLQNIQGFIESGELFVHNISWGTWIRFASNSERKPVNEIAFKIYCDILGLNWQKIQEITPEQSPKCANFSLISNLDELPNKSIFYGRENELTDLLKSLKKKKPEDKKEDQKKVILISGIAGIGKTTLIVNLLEQIKEQFDCIIYKNLSNPKPFSLFWYDLTNTNFTGDIMPLIEYFKRHRCLLIFDKWEELLQSEYLSGHYCQEYQEYGDFLTEIAKISTSHQSSVIIISQEKPLDFDVFSSQKLSVSSLELKGLSQEKLLHIFATQNIPNNTQGLTNLIKLYSYHPGVITLVAQDIKQEFNGNVLQYLSQSSLIVPDVIGNYIIQTFTKISPPEISIIYLLSIVTENLSQSQLKTVFDPYLSGTDILDTIKSLKRRSLLIQEDTPEITYSLLPFIKKYIRNQFIEKICANIRTVIKTENWANVELLITHPLVYPDTTNNLINPKLLTLVREKLIYSTFSLDLSAQLQDLLSKIDQKSLSELGYLQKNLNYLLEVVNYGNRTNN